MPLEEEDLADPVDGRGRATAVFLLDQLVEQHPEPGALITALSQQCEDESDFTDAIEARLCTLQRKLQEAHSAIDEAVEELKLGGAVFPSEANMPLAIDRAFSILCAARPKA